MAMSFVAAGNSERVKRQQEAPIFVIIGNPPYNAKQINENDNSKNRKYPVLDKWVAETYSKDSTATNKNALSDPYVKSFKWASKRIEENGEGIVAFVSNNSFLEDNLFDGMRKHLSQDFNKVYILDLKGNIRKDSMRDGIPLGEPHTVFGMAAMVGISIAFLIRKKDESRELYYSTVNFRATRAEKFALLAKAQDLTHLDWQKITPDERFTWLTEGLQADFHTFVPMGTHEAKGGTAEGVIFRTFTNGVKTNRDTWACNFNQDELARNISSMIDVYNDHVGRWQRLATKPNMDDFVLNDDTKIT